MRGKVVERLHSVKADRITPACAGKSSLMGARLSKRKDHPRVCGEKVKDARAQLTKEGSPPRVRGKVNLLTPVNNDLRITPACAGKSVMLWKLSPIMRDHPRVCGEKTGYKIITMQPSGSPPRVRGKAPVR